MLPPEPQREPQAAVPPQQANGEILGAIVSNPVTGQGRVTGALSSAPPYSPESLLPIVPDGAVTCNINLSSLPSLLREDLEDAPFWKEVTAFARLPRHEVETFDGQYVAVYNGNIVDNDPDEGELALRFYRTFGYVPVYIHFVGVEDALIDVYD